MPSRLSRPRLSCFRLCGLGAALLSVLLPAGCGLQLPSEYPISAYTRGGLFGKAADGDPKEPLVFAKAEDQATFQTVLTETFGTPADPHLPDDYMDADRRTQVWLGAQVYQRHCIHCHGLAGAGDGPTGEFLYPRPRDFRAGLFKWKGTAYAAKPTRDDLVRIIREGANGSAMPPFHALLTEPEIANVVEYVVYLSVRGEVERLLLGMYFTDEELPDAEVAGSMLEAVNGAWDAGEEALISPREAMPAWRVGSDEFEAAVVRGRDLYLSQKAGCYSCHLRDGTANRDRIPEAEKVKMVDDWGNPLYPRNLTLGIFHGGRRPIDLYRRIHQGVRGAPMQGFGTNLKDPEIWDLVMFLRALPYRPDLLPQEKPAASDHGHAHAH